MSTQQQQISNLLNANTVASSIQREWRDMRAVPEDLRTRRFGYNPGFQMQMDPVISGLQKTMIDAGVLILFESGPVRRQNMSVDPEDNAPPDRDAELLAGEGLGAIYQQNAHMGWREVLPLRGLGNEEAVDIFYYAHPPLSECVQNRLIEPCPYSLEVCITCRQNAIRALKGNVPLKAAPTLEVLEESVAVGRSYMLAQWNAWVGELAESQGVNRPRMALGQLQEGHFFFMRQLHERTPSDKDLYRLRMQSEMNADVLKEALAQQQDFLAAMFRNQEANNPVVLQMQQQITQLQNTLLQLQQQQAKSTDDNT